MSQHLDQILERFDEIEPHLPFVLDHLPSLAPHCGPLIKHIDALLLYADDGGKYLEPLLPCTPPCTEARARRLSRLA